MTGTGPDVVVARATMTRAPSVLQRVHAWCESFVARQRSRSRERFA